MYITMSYLRSTVCNCIDVNMTILKKKSRIIIIYYYYSCGVCNIYAIIKKYTINIHLLSNLQKYAQKKNEPWKLHITKR